MERKKIDYKKRLDNVFAQYIRLRDAMEGGVFKCISCGKIKPLRQADCGHYINRVHMSTRYSEMNCNAQCRACNRFDEGNMQGYRRGLVAKYGEQRVLLLEGAKYAKSSYSEADYRIMIDFYKKEVVRLKKEKLKFT